LSFELDGRRPVAATDFSGKLCFFAGQCVHCTRRHCVDTRPYDSRAKLGWQAARELQQGVH
jgi:hypothetical protein